MTGGAASPRPAAPGGTRSWLSIAAGVACLAALVPPLSTLSRHAEYAAALQFSIFAIVVPALVALGAPWRSLRLAARSGPGALGTAAGPLDRLAERRLRHPELARALVFVVLDLVAVVLWRTPGAVRAVAEHGLLVPVEALSLVVLGVGLWLELVESPPLVPRSGPLRRGALAAVAMWVFWTDAYVIGMSSDDWYRNFPHAAGHGLSAAADQQFASVALWSVAAAAFVPVIFWTVFRWLHGEEDPDAELHRLAKVEARRFPAPPMTSGPRRGAGRGT